MERNSLLCSRKPEETCDHEWSAFIDSLYDFENLVEQKRSCKDDIMILWFYHFMTSWFLICQSALHILESRTSILRSRRRTSCPSKPLLQQQNRLPPRPARRWPQKRHAHPPLMQHLNRWAFIFITLNSLTKMFNCDKQMIITEVCEEDTSEKSKATEPQNRRRFLFTWI